jgi:putative MATE family efflux protein
VITIRKPNLLEDRIGVLLVRLSFPPISGMVVYSFLGLVETFFVSQLGPASMAALTVCLPVFLLVVSLASATGVGLTALIAQAMGRGDLRNADNIAWHGLFISLVYSFIFTWLGLKNLDALLILFGCTPDIFALSREYLTINLWACCFTFPPMLITNIIQGEGNTVIPVAASLMTMVLNVILDPLLICGIGFIPPMGLNGAALASVTAQVVLTVALLIIIRKRRAFLQWSLRNFRPNLKIISSIYAIAIPSTVMEIVGVIVMVALNRVIAGYGYVSLAVLGIFLRIRSFFYMPISGLAQGALPLIGFSYGARKYERIRESIIKAMAASLLFMSLGWVIMQSCPGWIMHIFTSDQPMLREGIKCIRLSTLFIPVMGPVIIFYTVLQALGKGFTAMWLSLLRQVGLFLPLLFILPVYIGLQGVWLAFALSELLSIFVTSIFFIDLWRQLQTGRLFTMVMLLNPGFVKKRIRAWLKW